MDKQDRDKLLAEWIADGCLPDDEPKLLEELRRDEDFRKKSAKHLVVHRLLEQQRIPEGNFTAQVMETIAADQEGSTFADETVVKLQEYRRRRNRWMLAGIASAIAASILLAINFWPTDLSTTQSAIRVVATEGVGTFDFESLNRGEEVDLRRGIVELELNNESRVVFEGPSKFSIVSPQHVRLASGRCFAEMDKGSSGLRIETPSGDVLDLGTRFAVEVPTSSSMNVHVFDGEVEISDSEGSIRLKEGQGLTQSKIGKNKTIAAQPSKFVPRVPRPVALRGHYWSFSEIEGRNEKAVLARSSGGIDPVRNSTLIDKSLATNGPTQVPGKYGKALQFNGTEQWVNTWLPGIEGDVDRTVACWVKLPNDWGDNDRRAPLVSWGLKRRDVEDQAWLFGINGYTKRFPELTGRLRLGVGQQSASGVTDLSDGKWHHVAAVAITNSGHPTTLFYVDGALEQVSRGQIESINTETTEDRSQTIRFGRRVSSNLLFLRGLLDEVYILEGALSGDQIRALMRNELSNLFLSNVDFQPTENSDRIENE